MSRIRSALLSVCVAVAIVAVSLVASPAALPADAANSSPSGLPSTVTQDALPTVQINGVVWTQVIIGNTVYAGGSFTSARPAGSALGTNETARSNLLSYNLTTGALITTFAPTLNGQVKSLAASPDGTRLYVGGDFTTVNGVTQNRIAALDPTSGALVSAFAVSASSTVNAIVATASSVYFGGNFSSVNSKTRTRLAQVTTAGVLTTWAPTATAYAVQAMVLSPDATRVIVGGQFSALNGTTAQAIGALDATTGATLPFAASTLTTNGGATSSGVDSLTTDGTNIYAAGWGYTSGDFEATMSLNPSTGAVNWLNDCFGDTYSVATLGGALYVASHAHDCTAVGLFPDNGIHHAALAWSTTASGHNNLVDGRGWNYSAYSTSSLLQWNPTLKIGTFTGQNQAAWSVAASGNYVVMGGEFPSVNGTAQQGLVRFTTHAAAPNAYLPTKVLGLYAAQATVNGSPTVTISAAGSTDQDDSYVTYSLIRNGVTASPVATATVPTAGFWEVPNAVSLTDTTAVLGSTYTYKVLATSGGATSTSSSVSVTVTGVPVPDLAVNKPSTQSSNAFGTTAALAVDGNTDGVFADGSVSHTNTDTNSWWQTDLQGTVASPQIRIWNRTDCCSTRLSDFYVFFSATPFNTSLTPAQQATQAGVWSTHLTTVPLPVATVAVPSGTSGRYVMVQENTASQYLSLAEVQVYGTLTPIVAATDLALKKTATQSSDAFWTSGAALAVDGNTDGVFNDGSVTHTNADPNSWWQVDLGAATSLGSLAVWNRTDPCCTSRLSDYWVFTSSTPFNTALTPAQQATQAGVWSTHLTTAPSPSTTIALPTGTTARYVMVQENTVNQNLSLAEVQAFSP